MEKTRKAEPMAHKIHEEADEDEKYIQPRSNQPYIAVVDLLTNVFLAFIPNTIFLVDFCSFVCARRPRSQY
jgi:hypothetical protein